MRPVACALALLLSPILFVVLLCREASHLVVRHEH